MLTSLYPHTDDHTLQIVGRSSLDGMRLDKVFITDESDDNVAESKAQDSRYRLMTSISSASLQNVGSDDNKSCRI